MTAIKPENVETTAVYSHRDERTSVLLDKILQTFEGGYHPERYGPKSKDGSTAERWGEVTMTLIPV